MSTSFHDVAAKLENRLGHAFRYGSSAFRFGLIPQSVSDHLPVLADLPFGDQSIKMLSWNLLADEHLFNNFMNISGSDYLEQALNTRMAGKENIYAGAMYHLFAEMGQYLLKHSEDGNIKVTKELLEGFIANEAQPSRRALSRDAETARLKVGQVEDARKALVDILLDSKALHAHEYQLALKQSMELIYHIKAPDGALQWSNRFKRLSGNSRAVAELASQDILAFQECTKPDDLETLIKNAKNSPENMVFLTHNLSPSGKSTDNVVLAFNADKFQLVEQETPANPLKTSFEGKKPALYCKLMDKKTGKEFIVGSVHHPGGDHDLRQEVIDNVKKLQGKDSEIPFYIAGDYNHTAEQFAEMDVDSTALDPLLFYPSQKGTMAGSDYGNVNKAIDAIMSDQALTNRIKVSPSIVLAPPSPVSIRVGFDIPGHHLATTTIDATLKPHIIESQAKFKETLQQIKSEEASRVIDALPVKHDDDDPDLGNRISLRIQS
ncbi:exonuclease/endonuclease/phosphatase family protein [Legionella spiritensis]|uniref:Endonuclease/Exonuclease/phosphatase family protein n=1 Tax=Legionella spiritensis TaxID=452 RepID=A0A0W0ZA22_LEGSP|nr:hypothetical protein [Legionella spiritensis]KTD65758.1 Endonuclease/Exonuclease/phosphatase family protein [Legionella spiritensis]SNV42689.1 mRNA deadenylase, exonuclease subunit and related nucleases [Legionella spiritensis]